MALAGSRAASFEKGNPGKPKGAVNHITATFREALKIAYRDIGGHAQFTKWAKSNQTEFYKIMARLIPVELVGDVTVTVVKASELSDDDLAAIATGRRPAVTIEAES